MTQINITRDSNGKVTFSPVSIDITENVFFTNLDTQKAHWPYLDPNAASPDFCDDQVEPPPSPKSNSSQCNVPPPADLIPPNNIVTYVCKLHKGEQGVINVFAQLAAVNNPLPAAKVNKALPAPVQVVAGGKSPYSISGQMFQITDNQGNVIQQGSGNIGPGLQLSPDANNKGIWVSGIPTAAGIYDFTFNVDDGMKKNLQQVQYSMKVS